MEENKSILHELYVYSEWKPEPEYLQKSDNILPENFSALWCWLNFFGSKKSLLDSITTFKERQQKWHIALGDKGKVIAVLTDNILEIRTKRSDYATITARTTVSPDAYPQWRKLVWSPDCTFVAVAYGNGIISFFDLAASNLFNIPADCTRQGGRECTDNTHAVADIIFIPLRVKDNKWNWEVLVITYDGKVRGYLVSLTAGWTLRHTRRLAGAAAAARAHQQYHTLYVAGPPMTGAKDEALRAGLTAWRLTNDEPHYTLSVVSDRMDQSDRLQLYIPFVSSKNLAFIVQMIISPEGTKLVCLHCNGDISVWRLPLLKLLHRWPLTSQPHHDLQNPLVKEEKPRKDVTTYYAADVNWWSDEEIILSRFNGAVTVNPVDTMVNILGKKPEFFQGTPLVTSANDGTFMALECESNVLPMKKSRSDESMEVVKVESEAEDSMLDMAKELIKTVLYAITDIETFQPRPKKITVVSRVYRLLGVKSTTPNELFSRKIETGHYSEALALAEAFHLDSDLVYQQQWRKNPVSTDAIQNYLSKVSKKIWAVHQCVDRLPESLPAATALLAAGLQLTHTEILNEINKDREEDELKDPDDITLEDLNASTSELLRCRHVMLFYKERLRLYEVLCSSVWAILRCEKSTYQKDEYDRLRSNSIVHSSMEMAKEGRIEALTCLWPNIKTTAMQLAVLEKLPETMNPIDYQHLLPTKQPLTWFEKKSPIKLKPSEHENDWCRKEIFRSIWNSNWSEDTTPETEIVIDPTLPPAPAEDIAKWYDKRAREIEEHSGLVSHALTLVTIATVGGAVDGLDDILFHLLTLDTLIYDINVEGVTLKELQQKSILEICGLLMKMSTPQSFVADLKQYVIPFLKRYENLTKIADSCLNGLIDFLESISVEDLSSILLVLQSPHQFELDVRTHLEIAERCLFAHTGTEQMDKACDLLNTILKETDGSISSSSLVRRVSSLEKLVAGWARVAWRGATHTLRELRELHTDAKLSHQLLTRVARNLTVGDTKPTLQDWEKLLKDLLELQSSLFTCITKEQCYEIYASSLLTSGDATSIKLAAEVLTCEKRQRRNSTPNMVNYLRSVDLISSAAREYFNSASSLLDPALELARCCLTIIKDENNDIQEELDLIAALPVLNAFGLSILPIQVRLCENRMTLIEECLKLDPSAYLASHKLLKLAQLLRVAGNDERVRESEVLVLVGWRAVKEGSAGAACAAACAARLAVLRWPRAAALHAHVAAHAQAHADRAQRARLYAAAAAHCDAKQIHDILCARQALELESLQQSSEAVREHARAAAGRWASTDDEFADAITTPIIEKKDLVAPSLAEKLPIFNYIMDTFQNKLGSEPPEEASPRTIQVSPWYGSLYGRLGSLSSSSGHYQYDGFAPPPCAVAPPALRHYHLTHCRGGPLLDTEPEVIQKCAEELLYKDTPLSIACLLRSSEDFDQTKKLLDTHSTDTAVSAALYATLIKCNAPELRDNVYLTKPSKMARTTIQQKNASEEQLEIIRQCIDKLAGMGEVDKLKKMGLSVNALLFNADEDYRRETIYRLARSPDPSQQSLAATLGTKYGLDPVGVWLQRAAAGLANLAAAPPPVTGADVARRIKETLYATIPGTHHTDLIHYYTAQRAADERGDGPLTPADHVRLLKKAKAASAELDYKLLLNQPSSEEFLAHILQILKPENVGLLTKFLRGLPPALRPPVSVNTIYVKWLTKYFFSVAPSSANNKKWMQQYRQCASYFNKLTKEDLVQFVANTCFTIDVVQRVPAGTRNLMIMQAVDYCQQEQENDFKFNKNEQSWSQVGQELTRWARFLENFHSTTVQALVDASRAPPDTVWPDIECSHGDTEALLEPFCHLIFHYDLRASALTSLLQCLHVDLTPVKLFQHLVDTMTCADDIQTLVFRITQYNKDGVKFPDELLESAMSKSTDLGIPAPRPLGLMALGRRVEKDDPVAAVQFTLDMLKTEWPDVEFEEAVTEEILSTEAGRRSVYSTLARNHRPRPLAAMLGCWPPDRELSPRSVHAEFIHQLLTDSRDQKESVELIKLLLRRPVLTETEVQWISESASSEAAVGALWVIILGKCARADEELLRLVAKHKESLKAQEIEDDLVKELLECGLFTKLVSTPLYNSIVNYIISNEASNENSTKYNIAWATNELMKANCIAEAGKLRLMIIGVPTALQGFTQSVAYIKNMLTK